MSLKARLIEDMKAAMKGGEKDKLLVIRLINSGIKQREVDERIELDDAQVLGVIEKMIKQRRDSIAQYEKGARPDLVAQEQFEIDLLSAYLPQQATDAEVDAIVAAAVAAVGAKGIADMGKVMGQVKAQLAGRADMGKVSARVKAKLAG